MTLAWLHGQGKGMSQRENCNDLFPKELPAVFLSVLTLGFKFWAQNLKLM